MNPTDRQVRDLCETLRKTDWRDVQKRLLAAMDRDRRGGGKLEPDGYPSTTTPGGSGGAELTSVESAVERRVYGKPERDHLHHNLTTALDMLEQACMSRNAIHNRLALIDQQLEQAPLTVEHCELCNEAGVQHGWDHYGDMDGFLPRPMHLCSSVYGYVYKRGEKPTHDQIRSYAMTGRWRLRVDPKEKTA